MSDGNKDRFRPIAIGAGVAAAVFLVLAILFIILFATKSMLSIFLKSRSKRLQLSMSNAVKAQTILTKILAPFLISYLKKFPKFKMEDMGS